jgi:hypothetical protein
LKGLLTGSIVQTAEPGTELVFSFDVKNPPEGRFGSTVSISMCEMPWIAMQSGPGNFQPGLVSVILCPLDVRIIMRVIASVQVSMCSCAYCGYLSK